MNAFIYCRVFPDNKKVSAPDKLKAQDKRCRDFARQHRIRVLRTFNDEGDMPPQRFLPYMRLMLSELARQKKETLVISDHSARLGLKVETRNNVMHAIEDMGGQFLAVHSSSRSLAAEILEQLYQEEGS